MTGYIAAPKSHYARGTELSVRFEPGPTAASSARNVLLALDQRLDPRLLDDVRLLVSELVTNSIRHSDAPTGGKVCLDVSIQRGCVRVEVADMGAGFDPVARDTDASRPGGWGLYLVDRIADRWGVAKNAMTRVWFEIEGA